MQSRSTPPIKAAGSETPVETCTIMSLKIEIVRRYIFHTQDELVGTGREDLRIWFESL